MAKLPMQKKRLSFRIQSLILLLVHGEEKLRVGPFSKHMGTQWQLGA
jgi:hypothetical protein